MMNKPSLAEVLRDANSTRGDVLDAVLALAKVQGEARRASEFDILPSDVFGEALKHAALGGRGLVIDVLRGLLESSIEDWGSMPWPVVYNVLDMAERCAEPEAFATPTIATVQRWLAEHMPEDAVDVYLRALGSIATHQICSETWWREHCRCSRLRKEACHLFVEAYGWSAMSDLVLACKAGDGLPAAVLALLFEIASTKFPLRKEDIDALASEEIEEDDFARIERRLQSKRALSFIITVEEERTTRALKAREPEFLA